MLETDQYIIAVNDVCEKMQTGNAYLYPGGVIHYEDDTKYMLETPEGTISLSAPWACRLALRALGYELPTLH